MATAWFVVLPFFQPYNTYQHIGGSLISYPQFLSYYVPDLAVGAVFLMCQPLVFLQPRFAVMGLLFAAMRNYAAPGKICGMDMRNG